MGAPQTPILAGWSAKSGGKLNRARFHSPPGHKVLDKKRPPWRQAFPGGASVRLPAQSSLSAGTRPRRRGGISDREMPISDSSRSPMEFSSLGLLLNRRQEAECSEMEARNMADLVCCGAKFAAPFKSLSTK